MKNTTLLEKTHESSTIFLTCMYYVGLKFRTTFSQQLHRYELTLPLQVKASNPLTLRLSFVFLSQTGLSFDVQSSNIFCSSIDVV